MRQEETEKDNPFGISEPGSGDHFIDLDDYEELHRALKAGDYSYHSRSGYLFITDYFRVGRFLLCATGDFDQNYMICNHNKPGHMIYNTWLPVTCGKLWELEKGLEARKAESAKGAEDAARRKKYEPSPVVAPLPNPPKNNSKREPGYGVVWVYIAIGLLIAANS